MNIDKKHVFLIVMLLAVLMLAATISATGTANGTVGNAVDSVESTAGSDVVEKASDNNQDMQNDMETEDVKKNNIIGNTKQIKTTGDSVKTTNKSIKDAGDSVKTTNKSIKTTDASVSSYSQLVSTIAHASSEDLSINLESGDYNITQQLVIASDTIKTLKINGNNQIIDGQGQNSFLIVANGIKLNISNLAIQNTYGYAIYSQADVALDNVAISGNKAVENNFGSIYNGGTLTANYCSFNNNYAIGTGSVYGAAICNAGNLTANNCNFTGNIASANQTMGGAICGGNLVLDGCSFTNNIANGEDSSLGGALCVYGNTTIRNTAFNNNSAQSSTASRLGGAIAFYLYNNEDASEKHIINSTFLNNKANYGSALYALANTTITNSSFKSNSADTGGTLYNTQALYVVNSTFDGNAAGGFGGAIDNAGNLIADNSNFTSNTAAYGSAISNSIGSTSLTNSNFANNIASGFGGAIFNNATLLSDNTTFASNSAVVGGAIYNVAIAVANNTIFASNNATNYGGAFYNEYGLLLGNSTFKNNTAIYGGAVYNSATLIVDNGTFISNNASGYGGVAYNQGTFILGNSSLDSNRAAAGGILFDVGSSESANNTFANNHASYGAIVYSANNGILNLINNTFTSNTADFGLIYNQNTTMAIAYNNFKNNNVTNALLYTLTNSTTAFNYNNLTDNVLAGADGYMIFNAGSLSINANNFINNTNLTRGDVLFAPTTKDSAIANTYINNSLATFIGLTNASLADDNLVFNLTVSLRDVYNFTVNSGTVRIYINNQLYQPPVEYAVSNGKLMVEVPYGLLTQSVNNLTFEYVPLNGDCQPSAMAVTINKEIKYYSNISAQLPRQFIANNTYQINITLTDNATGSPLANQNITVNTETTSATVQTDSDGVARYNYLANTNDKSINMTYYGSDTYYGYGLGYYITVYKMPTWIIVSEGLKPIQVNDTIQINITLLTNENMPISGKSVNIVVDNENYELVTGNDGIATYTYTPTTIGLKNITVSFEGDEAYINSTNATVLTVNKINTSLAVNTSPVRVNQNAVITVGLTDGDNNALSDRMVALTVDGNTLTNSTNSNGVAIFNYLPSAVGQMQVVATYGGDDNYNKSEAASTLIVADKIITYLSVEASDAKVNRTSVIIAALKDENNQALASKSITLVVNGTTLTNTTDGSGVCVFYYVPSSAGSYNVAAAFNGDNDYSSAVNSTALYVDKLVTSLAIGDVSDLKVNQNAVITVGLTDEYNQKLIGKEVALTINGTALSNKTGSNGIALFNYKPSKAGVYEVVANFYGDNNYLESTNNTNLNIGKLTTHLTISNISDLKVNQNAVITVGLTDGDNNALSDRMVALTVDGNTLTNSTNSNGVAIFNYLPSAVGQMQVVATYGGDDNYNKSEAASTLIVADKIITYLSVEASDAKVNRTSVIIAALKDENNQALASKSITLVVNGTTLTNTTDGSGVCVFYYVPSSAGSYSVAVAFNGDNDYSSAVNSTTLNVDKLTTNLIINNISESKINQTTTITVNLTDEYNQKLIGKEVTLTIDGTALSNKTGSNGICVFNYVPSSAGSYSVAAAFNGDGSYYYPSANSTTLTISKLSTILYINDISTVMVNQTATIKVALTDENNNALKDKEVLIDIMGTVLTNKTGSNGIAAFNCKPSKAGTYEVVANFYGDNTYYQSTSTAAFAAQLITPTVKLVTDNIKVKIGSNVTLIAVITDNNNKLVKEGDAVFKINNVTLKDANGKSIKVKVTNGIASLNYTIPTTYSGRDYKINVVYAGTNYARAETKGVLTAIKQNTHMQANIISTNKNGTTTLNVKILDENNSLLQRNVTISIKVNGKTLLNRVTLAKGESNYTLTLKQKSTPYNITIVTADNSNYKGSVKTLIYHTSPASTLKTTSQLESTVAIKTKDNTAAQEKTIKAAATTKNSTVTLLTNNIKANIGSNITLMALVTDENGTLVNEGNAIFKINNVTIKDTNGNALKAKVADGIAQLNYTLPLTFSGNTYTITAVYSGTNYARAESTGTLTPVKLNTYIDANVISRQQNGTTTLQVNIYDQNNNQLERNVTISIKVNGKTVLNKVKLIGGESTYTLTLKQKSTPYNITITTADNSNYKGSNTTLIYYNPVKT